MTMQHTTWWSRQDEDSGTSRGEADKGLQEAGLGEPDPDYNHDEAEKPNEGPIGPKSDEDE